MSSVLFNVQIPKKHDGPKGIEVECLPLVEQAIASLAHSVTVLEDVSKSKYELVFPAHRDLNAEPLIAALESVGVGHEFGSISLGDLAFGLPDGPLHEDVEVDTDFKESVTSRLVIHQLLQETNSATAFSFDYIMLCIMGSIIATMGLAIASPAIIVASMLVSPVLGPITATAFGTILCDWKLFRRGMFSEISGIGLCVLTGFITGIGLSVWGDWLDLPTIEMVARGEPYTGLIIGAFIALPSGVGVGLSVLGNNTPVLIGVAISASLLPPAANCGFFFAYGLFGQVLSGKVVDSYSMYEQGTVSLCITILNIICIYLAAVAIFRVKEVVPLPFKSELWKTFIPEVRKQNTSQASEGRQQIIEEIVRESDAARQTAHRSSSIFGSAHSQARFSLALMNTSPETRTSIDQYLTARDRSIVRTRSVALSQAKKVDSKNIAID